MAEQVKRAVRAEERAGTGAVGLSLIKEPWGRYSVRAVLESTGHRERQAKDETARVNAAGTLVVLVLVLVPIR